MFSPGENKKIMIIKNATKCKPNKANITDNCSHVAF